VPACFVRQAHRFQFGVREEAGDACALGGLDRAFASSGYDVVELFAALAASQGFARRSGP